MTIERAALYTIDGRQRGSYVYMVLWQVASPIHIKVGRSSTPLSSLSHWNEARVISVAEVPSLRAAVRLEAELREAFSPWHSYLEWFTVLPEERAEFNAAWHPVIAAHSSSPRRICWRNYSVPDLLSAAARGRRERQRRFMQRPLTYHDYRKG
jgi:hypothetical protein